MGPCGCFLSVFVISKCYFGRNDDSICKITEPMFCLLVDSPVSGNNILYIKQHQSDKDTKR
jgi:hypothetical protein